MPMDSDAVDFSKYSDAQLEASLTAIDSQNRAEAFEACSSEIARRRKLGIWKGSGELISSPGTIYQLHSALGILLPAFGFVLCALSSPSSFESSWSKPFFLCLLASFAVFWFAVTRIVWKFRNVRMHNSALEVEVSPQTTVAVPFADIQNVDENYINRDLYCRVETKRSFSFGNEFFFLVRSPGFAFTPTQESVVEDLKGRIPKSL